MSQDNPFPDWVPKVGDVVRIGRNAWFQEATIVDRFGNFGDIGDPFVGISVFVLGIETNTKGFHRPSLAQYFWDDQNETWQLNNGGRTLKDYKKDEGFRVEIIRRAP